MIEMFNAQQRIEDRKGSMHKPLAVNPELDADFARGNSRRSRCYQCLPCIQSEILQYDAIYELFTSVTISSQNRDLWT